MKIRNVALAASWNKISFYFTSVKGYFITCNGNIIYASSFS